MKPTQNNKHNKIDDFDDDNTHIIKKKKFFSFFFYLYLLLEVGQLLLGDMVAFEELRVDRLSALGDVAVAAMPGDE